MKKLITMALLAVVALAGCKKDDNTDNGGGNKPGPQPEPETPVITITTQPVSPTPFTVGEITGSLTVAATVTEDATLSYQWYSNTTNSSTGGTVATGATAKTATFTIPTDLTAGDYFYFCEVSATGGATAKRSNVAKVTVKEPEYVLINGVKWAKTNVNAAGTFVAKPEDGGMFYQWNRKTGWPATGDVTGWDKTTPTGDTWEAANDPCPEGWRVPTRDEFTALCDATKVTSEWDATLKGRKFTDIASGKSIFLPAVGYRTYSEGALSNTNTYAYYWTATPYSTTSGLHGSFSNSIVHSVGSGGRNNGMSVRCVVK